MKFIAIYVPIDSLSTALDEIQDFEAKGWNVNITDVKIYTVCCLLLIKMDKRLFIEDKIRDMCGGYVWHKNDFI